ncbi:isoamylase early set domain-containing protein [soil metagenome]
MLKKRYAKDSKTCQVTFTLPKEVSATSAVLCGDFNAWSDETHPMERAADGSFKVAIRLPAGQHYCYRYLLDGERWENDWQADRYEPNAHGSDNSVVEL